MSVVVVGCGRSGTNMLLEILASSPDLTASDVVEDKLFFRRDTRYNSGYLTKCDTVYFSSDQFDNTMRLNPGLKVVWAIRDPRDMALSKIRRGQPKVSGGDAVLAADDGSPDGCLKDMNDMAVKYRAAIALHGERIHLVRMEDVIENVSGRSGELCRVLGVRWCPEMETFYERMRNSNKRSRYNSVDRNELAKWKNWRSCYGGFFADADYDILGLFESLHELVVEFGYAD